VLDHNQVSITNPTPYVSKNFIAFSQLGQECWRRAADELEHRHSMEGGSVHEQDLANGLLDLRTKNSHHMSASEFSDAKVTLQQEYLDYNQQFNEYMIAANKSLNPDAAVPQAQPSVSIPVEPNPSEPPFMFCIGVNPHTKPTETQPQHPLDMQRESFQKYLRAWLALDIDWLSEFPELQKLNKANNELDVLSDLLPLNMSALYLKLLDTGLYGQIPRMGIQRLGSDLASGYVERVNSAASQVMPEGYTLLGELPLEMLTLLRINKDFIIHFETHHHKSLCKLVKDIPMSSDLKSLLL
jgi:hypothetical protein